MNAYSLPWWCFMMQGDCRCSPLDDLTWCCRGPRSTQQLPRALRHEAARWLQTRALTLRGRGEPLGVCIMTADFWGLRSAGGTATAYHLLAQVILALPHRMEGFNERNTLNTCWRGNPCQVQHLHVYEKLRKRPG